MAITAQQVYDLALGLIDEVTESGSFSPDNPDYYKSKALAFLTMLQTELLPVSTSPVVLQNMNETLLLSDRLCLSVLPYGLGAHLIMSEDQNAASFLNARYDELKRKIPTSIQPITDTYGVLDGLRLG